jgi:hypothetical protein
MALVLGPELAQNLNQVFDQDLDIPAEGGKRTIPCGERSIERSRFVEEVTAESTNKLIQEHSKKINFFKKFQAVM